SASADFGADLGAGRSASGDGRCFGAGRSASPGDSGGGIRSSRSSAPACGTGGFAADFGIGSSAPPSGERGDGLGPDGSTPASGLWRFGAGRSARSTGLAAAVATP